MIAICSLYNKGQFRTTSNPIRIVETNLLHGESIGSIQRRRDDEVLITFRKFGIAQRHGFGELLRFNSFRHGLGLKGSDRH